MPQLAEALLNPSMSNHRAGSRARQIAPIAYDLGSVFLGSGGGGGVAGAGGVVLSDFVVSGGGVGVLGAGAGGGAGTAAGGGVGASDFVGSFAFSHATTNAAAMRTTK